MRLEKVRPNLEILAGESKYLRSRHFLIYSGPFFCVEFGGDVRNAIYRRNRDSFGIFSDSLNKTLSWCRVCALTNAWLAGS